MPKYKLNEDPYLHLVNGKNSFGYLKMDDLSNLLIGTPTIFTPSPGGNDYFLKRNFTGDYMPKTVQEALFFYNLWIEAFSKKGDNKGNTWFILAIIVTLTIKEKKPSFSKITDDELFRVLLNFKENIYNGLKERNDPKIDPSLYAIKQSGMNFSAQDGFGADLVDPHGVITKYSPTISKKEHIEVRDMLFQYGMKLVEHYKKEPYLINDFINAIYQKTDNTNTNNNDTNYPFIKLGEVNDPKLSNSEKISFIMGDYDETKIAIFKNISGATTKPTLFSRLGVLTTKATLELFTKNPILQFAKIGVIIKPIEEPYLKKIDFPVIAVRVPFYIWIYLSDYMNVNFLGEGFSKIWISSTKKKAIDYLNSDNGALSLLGDTKIFTETKKWYDALRLRWQEQKIDDPISNEFAEMTDRDFNYYEKNFENTEEPIPTGLFVMTFRESIQGSNGKSAKVEILYDLLKRIIAENIVKGLVYKPLENALPQKKARSLVKAREIYKKKLAFTTTYGKGHIWLPDVVKTIPVLMFEPIPQISSEVLRTKTMLETNQERYYDKKFIVPDAVLKARRALGGLVMKNEDLEIAGPLSDDITTAKEEQKKLIGKYCTSMTKTRNQLLLEARKLDLKIFEDESDIKLCGRIEAKLLEKANREIRQPQKPLFYTQKKQ